MKRVLVTGTFEIIHPGHLHLIRTAAKLGQVHVIVARNKNAAKAKHRKIVVDEKQRAAVVAALKGVHKVWLGHPKDIFLGVKRVHPNIILLGPDQMPRRKAVALLKKYGIKAQVRQLKKRFRGHYVADVSKLISRFRNV